MSFFVVNNDQNLLITQAAQLYCFFQEPSLSFAEGYISLKFVINQSKFIDFLFTHANSSYCLSMIVLRYDVNIALSGAISISFRVMGYILLFYLNLFKFIY